MNFPAMFALTGAVQGGVLWWLWRAQAQTTWPATEPMIQIAMLYAALAVPLAIYFTQNIERLPVWARRAAVALYLVLYAALGAYTAWAADASSVHTSLKFADTAAALVLGFVSVALLCGFDFEARRWRYERLFNYAWRNGILLVTAWAMVGAVWLVLFAGAGLMSLIGVKWVMETIQKPVFAFPVTGLVVAAAFALGLARAAMTDTIRRFWLSINAWLLPLVLFFAVLWVLALPFTGLEGLFKTQSAAFMMLGFMALAVKFSNCAYQDGEAGWPYPAWLSRATQLAWLALLVVVAIAWWALGLRIAQPGWSEQRLWAALAAALAAVYALGYALSWFKPQRWMALIAPTNIAAAVLLCLALLLLLSPVANIRRLAVAAHISHVTQANGTQEPDWAYLRWNSGRYGREALQGLSAGTGVPVGQDWAKQAARALAQTSRYDNKPEEVTAQTLAEKFTVYPKGRSLPGSFAQQMQGGQQAWEVQRCLKASVACPVWLGDLNGDGQDELLLFYPGSAWSGSLFMQTRERWLNVGNVSSYGMKEKFDPSQLEGAKVGKAEWGDLMVQGQRLRVRINN